ncbi:MAG TPA: aldo/keto reductase [Candidatus Baltobacteraceae bacterium]|nr:aldo/keto reductase [Candidatus Baltobacteraceae bacterium]
MEYRKVGRTGLKVSAFCLGTMMFGRQIEEDESLRIIQAAIDAGVTFIDTADMYANGVTEEILAKAIKGNRDSLVLASKAGHIRKLADKYGEQRIAGPIDLARPRAFHPWPGGDHVGHNDMGLSRKHLMQALEGSLRRLGTEYLDIYYAHMPDYDTPLDETMRAMDDMVRQGKVRYLGCSNFRAFQVSKALWISDTHNLARWDLIQPPFNLLARDIEYELLPLCLEEGIGVAVFSPLAAGFLSGKYEKGKPPIEGRRFSLGTKGFRYNEKYWTDLDFDAVERLKEIAADHGKSLAQFALAWVLNKTGITSIVCGATSVEQLRQNLGAVGIRLTPEELTACDAVWQMLHPPRLFYGR